MNEFKIYSRESPMSRKHFSQLFKIMEYSFPKNEHRNFEEQFGEYKQPFFRTLTLEKDDKIAGFMNYWELPGFVYLEHFAVIEEMRHCGLGRTMIAKLRETAKGDPIIIEVEPADTSEYAVHRIEFYKRLGFCENSYEYYQPPYNIGEKPLRLMIMSSPAPLSSSEFIHIRNMIYRDAYRADFSTK